MWFLTALHRQPKSNKITCRDECITSFCLFQHNTIKANGHVEVQLHTFLTSVLDGGVWSPSLPRRFIRDKDAPGTHQSLPRLRECFTFVASLPSRCAGTHQSVDMRFVLHHGHTGSAPQPALTPVVKRPKRDADLLPLPHKTHKRPSHEQYNVTQ